MKWGVLGTANIALRSMMPSILSIESNELIAVASRNQTRAKEVSESFGIIGLGSYEALLDRPDIEAVYIPLPNSLHYEWVTKSLEAGKHVLVEKSAFVTLEEAQKAVALARTKGLAIVENFQFQHHSQHRVVRQLLHEGAIGSVRSVRASFGFPPFGGETNIRYDKSLGGGALLDSGAYTLKATSFLFGKKFKVKAAHLTYNEKYDVDWFGGAFLVDTENEICSELAWGFDNFYQCNYEIWGSTGKITVPRAYTAKSDFSPLIILENINGTQEIVVEADDHFRHMLNDFNRIVSEKIFNEELENIITQARLVDAVKNLSINN